MIMPTEQNEILILMNVNRRMPLGCVHFIMLHFSRGYLKSDVIDFCPGAGWGTARDVCWKSLYRDVCRKWTSNSTHLDYTACSSSRCESRGEYGWPATRNLLMRPACAGCHFLIGMYTGYLHMFYSQKVTMRGARRPGIHNTLNKPS